MLAAKAAAGSTSAAAKRMHNAERNGEGRPFRFRAAPQSYASRWAGNYLPPIMIWYTPTTSNIGIMPHIATVAAGQPT